MATPPRPGGPIPDDHVIVISGATGDLARRKLLPGLYHLSRAGLLPDRYRIIGSAPAEVALDDDAFREHAHEAVTEFGRTKPEGREWQDFESRLTFAAADPEDPGPLLAAVQEAEQAIGGRPGLLHHLAVPPQACASVVRTLGACGLAQNARVIVEKPFGTDLASARALNQAIHTVFDESRVFRIDHFLGKESVDNILALRFANGLLEPVWNRDHISHVQIDVPEHIDIQGRAHFFEGTGTFRDMIVTHLFQLLGFIAMEPPATLDANSLRAEKDKVFRSMRPLDPTRVVRGQYEGYRGEPGVDPASDTETLAALRLEIDNWRWAASPSTCVPAKPSRRAATSSPSASANRPYACSRWPPRSQPKAATTNWSSTSTTPAPSPHASLPSSPAPPCVWPRRDGLRLCRFLRPGPRAGGLRAPHPGRHAR